MSTGHSHSQKCATRHQLTNVRSLVTAHGAAIIVAGLATLIDVVILNWFALRLSKLSIDAVAPHQR